MKQALGQVIDVLASNAGNTGTQVSKKILASSNPNFGWDGTKDEFCDMIKRGILDPVKVVKAAVINAAAAVSLLLTTECIVVDLPKDEEPKKKNGI